jgi:hypothetical protein
LVLNLLKLKRLLLLRNIENNRRHKQSCGLGSVGDTRNCNASPFGNDMRFLF